MSKPRKFLLSFGALYVVLLATSTRFRPPEFRPWEILRLPSYVGFYANRRVELEAYGDLAFKSAVPSLRRPRRVVFTTDRWGFRNTTNMPRPRIVVIGDSFAAGSGVSDEQTLAARLAERSGTTVYDYAMEPPGVAALFLREARFREHPPERVVYAPVERNLKACPLELDSEPKTERPPSQPPSELPPASLSLRYAEALTRHVAKWTTDANRDNGLQHFMRDCYNEGRYQLLGDANGVTVTRVDDERALIPTVRQLRLHESLAQRGVEPFVAMLVELKALLARRGSKLVFCPIPEVGTVYPEIFPPAEQATIASPAMLDVALERARSSGIDTVDLKPAFTANKVPYLYLRDDSHWTPRAIDLAASAIAAHLAGVPSP